MTFLHVIPPWLNLLLVALGTALCVLGFKRAKARSERRAWLRRSTAVGLVGLIGLGPGVVSYWEKASTNLAVYFVVDATGSMGATDYVDGMPRTEGVRADMVAIAEQLPQARFSIIAFSSVVMQQLPLTTDVRAVASWAETYDREPTSQSRGTDINSPVEELRATFEQAEESRPNDIRVVIYMGDGESAGTESAAGVLPEFGPIAPYVDEALVLGYGSPEGATMPYMTVEAGPLPDRYIIDPATGEPAISRINEANLGLIAEQLDGSYVHRSAPGGIAQVLPDVSGYAVENAEGEAPVYAPVIWPMAIALWAIIMWETWGLVGQLRSTRQLANEDPSVGWFE